MYELYNSTRHPTMTGTNGCACVRDSGRRRRWNTWHCDLDDLLADEDTAVFMAFNENGQPVGFIEVSLRSFAEGCESSPVGYIEAWFVGELVRGQKLGRDLVHTAEQWAREKGCSEMASDTWLENEGSIAAHQKLGYHEADRLVHFVKRL